MYILFLYAQNFKDKYPKCATRYCIMCVVSLCVDVYILSPSLFYFAFICAFLEVGSILLSHLT